MSADQLRSVLDQIDVRLSALHQTESGEIRELDRAETEEFDELSTARHRVEQHLRVRSQFDRNPAAVQTALPRQENGHSAPSVMHRGDPWADTYRTAPDAPEHRSELRGRALTAVEKLPRLSDAAKQVATLAIEDDDDRE